MGHGGVQGVSPAWSQRPETQARPANLIGKNLNSDSFIQIRPPPFPEISPMPRLDRDVPKHTGNWRKSPLPPPTHVRVSIGKKM